MAARKSFRAAPKVVFYQVHFREGTGVVLMRAVPAGDKSDMVAQYMTENTGMAFDPGMFVAFAVLNDNDEFVAGVVITNYRDWDCEISCASETPTAWRPEVCNVIFSYIFEQLHCVRCTSSTTRGNKRARGFLEALGFQLEGKLRRAYDGTRDALVYGLLAGDCRFLAGGLSGKINTEGTDAARSSSDGSSPSAG